MSDKSQRGIAQVSTALQADGTCVIHAVATDGSLWRLTETWTWMRLPDLPPPHDKKGLPI